MNRPTSFALALASVMLFSAGTDPVAAAPTTVAIPEYRSGITLSVQGVYGTDYLVEQLYHDPKLDPHVVIYVKSTAPIALTHNAQNSFSGGPTIGVNNPGTVIRYKVDKNLNGNPNVGFGIVWTNGTPIHTAYTGPISFSQLTYETGVPVVGTTGSRPGFQPTDHLNYYWRGMIGPDGEEWHELQVGDDDANAADPNKPTFYGRFASDGKLFYFVVNPKAPAITFHKNDPSAQWYTTPPKAYNIPQIREQTSYLSGDLSIEIAALGGAATEYSIVAAGSAPSWQAYQGPLRTTQLGLQPDTRYDLSYRSVGGPSKKRVIHYQPAYPSDAESHPRNLYWSGAAELARVKHRAKNPAQFPNHAAAYNNSLNSSFVHQRNGSWDIPLYQGGRRTGAAQMANAIPLFVDGVGLTDALHREIEQYFRLTMLDNQLALDPVGFEINHNGPTPTGYDEYNFHGYLSNAAPRHMAEAYTLLIKTFRPPLTPSGFTPIEDLLMRDRLASFANLAMQELSADYANFIAPNGCDGGMWSTSWTSTLAVIAAAMPNYDSDLYGTSGAPGGVFSPPRPWTPYPNFPRTWWQAVTSSADPGHQYPDQVACAGPYGLISADPADPQQILRFRSRPDYYGTSLMGKEFGIYLNLRIHQDGGRLPHLEQAVSQAIDGQLQSTVPAEGNVDFCNIFYLNQYFPALAAKTEAKLAGAGSSRPDGIRSNAHWVSAHYGFFLDEPDWRTIPATGPNPPPAAPSGLTAAVN